MVYQGCFNLALFDELNKISKQIDAIDSGELKIYQFYAFKPPN